MDERLRAARTRANVWMVRTFLACAVVCLALRVALTVAVIINSLLIVSTTITTRQLHIVINTSMSRSACHVPSIDSQLSAH